MSSLNVDKTDALYTDLVVFIPGDETSGSVLEDISESGNQHNATLSFGTTFTTLNGKNAIQVVGNGLNQITIPDHDDFGVAGESFSIAMWVSVTGTEIKWYNLISHGSYSYGTYNNHQGFYMKWYGWDGRVDLGIQGDTKYFYDDIRGTSSLRHLVITYDDANLQGELFLDGVSLGTFPVAQYTNIETGNDVLIGGDSDSTLTFGRLQWWRDRVLTASEVSTLYNDYDALIDAGGGGVNVAASMSLGLDASLTPDKSARMNGALLVQGVAGVVGASQAVVGGEVAVDLSSQVLQAATGLYQGGVTIQSTSNIVTSNTAIFNGQVNVSVSLEMTPSTGTAQAVQGLMTITTQLGVSPEAIGVFGETVSFTTQSTISNIPQAILQASILVGAVSDITDVANKIVSAGFSVGLSSAVDDSRTALGAVDFSLSTESIIENISTSIVNGTFDLQASLGLVHTASAGIQASLLMGIEQALQTEGQYIINGEIVLSHEASQVSSVLAMMGGEMTVGVTASLSAVASAIIQAGFQIASIGDITTDGASISTDVTLTDGRTYVVQLAVRSMDLDTREKEYKIHRQNRILNIKK